MIKRRILCLSLLSALVFADSKAQDLQQKLNAIRTMKAHFSQRVTAQGRVISSSSGQMALSRPGKFRWQSESPMSQLIIADGQKLWIYDVDLEQVTVKKQTQGLGDTAALFLSGYNETLADDFKISLTQSKGNMVFQLKPLKKDATYTQVQLDFNQDKLTGLTFFDQLGQKTQVRLSSIQQNLKLSSTLFTFNPPKGVDVVEQ